MNTKRHATFNHATKEDDRESRIEQRSAVTLAGDDRRFYDLCLNVVHAQGGVGSWPL